MISDCLQDVWMMLQPQILQTGAIFFKTREKTKKAYFCELSELKQGLAVWEVCTSVC